MLPLEEAAGANVMPVNEKLFLSSGYPILLGLARKYYEEKNLVVLDMSENEKMDGGLTCLSLRY